MTMTNTYCATPICRPRATGIVGRILQALALRRQRAALARLDEAALKDIGLSRDEAQREARRKAWDVPANWRC